MNIKFKLSLSLLAILSIMILGLVFQNILVTELKNLPDYDTDMSKPALKILHHIDVGFLKLNLELYKILISDSSVDFDSIKNSLNAEINSYDILTFEKNNNGLFYADSKMQDMMQNYVAEYKKSLKQFTGIHDELISNHDVNLKKVTIQLDEAYDEVEKIISTDIHMEEQGSINSQNQIQQSSDKINNVILFSNLATIVMILITLVFTAKSISSQQNKIKQQEVLLSTRNIELEKELLEKQKELIKSERFSAIGELSARIAHDIRNPLSVIRTSVDNIRQMPNDQEFVKKSITKCDRAISRITHQVDEVMDFLKDVSLNFEQICLSNLIQSTVNELTTPDGIKIILPSTNGNISGDKVKLESLFYNLIVNAIQKLKDKGTITIRIFEESNNMVKITVEDDGKPIDEDSLSQIFEPLYTTKQEGTGLGLASCKKIIQQHKGTISVTNDPVTFTVILPTNLVNQ